MRAPADRSAIVQPFVHRPDADLLNRMRLVHGASAEPPWVCRSCGTGWPCEVRLHLDEMCGEAGRRFAGQLHSAWTSGTPTHHRRGLSVTQP